MTDLIEFRRQRQIRKRIEQLSEQANKQSTALSDLQTLFKEHAHEAYATKTELGEKYVEKTDLPKPYVHPKTGVCPQKPQPHGHITRDIADLKIPDPYDFEKLKRDHPKLQEPYLHEPKKHTHLANELAGKIQPAQIETEGLNADTVDNKHVKDLIAEITKKARRVYVGGGPTQIAVALKFGAEGATTTSTVYVTIANSDIAFNPALLKTTGTLYVKFIYHIKNDTPGQTTYIRVLRQNAGTPIEGSEASVEGSGWGIVETAWIDWSAEATAESYQIQLKVTGGVGEFNSALMVLSSVQL